MVHELVRYMKLYMFRTVPLSIIRSFSLYTQQWYMSYRLCWQLASRSICSCSQAVSVTCMTYTMAVCTVKNSWWWTEELSETCTVSFQIKFVEISASSWFYNKKSIFMSLSRNTALNMVWSKPAWEPSIKVNESRYRPGVAQRVPGS